MAAFLTWLTQWQTGIDWIDENHREIAAILNRLVDVNRRALTEYPPPPGRPVLAVLDVLIERARVHFDAEEAFLREIRFPGYEGHRCEHVMQLAEFVDLRRTLEQDDAPGLSPDTLDDFKRWFFNHVVIEDRGYVDYYQGVIAAAATLPQPGALTASRAAAATYRDQTD